MSESLETEMGKFVENLTPQQLLSLVDSRIEELFNVVLERIEAHDGSMWARPAGQDALVIAYNASHDTRIECKVTQGLHEGLVSKAFNEQTTVCHQGIFEHSDRSDRVDRQLGQLTAHQIAAPFSLFGRPAGVATAIQTYSDGITQKTHWGFDEKAIRQFNACVAAAAGLLEYGWLKGNLGIH